MEKSVQQLIDQKGGNYILPFLWMRGEDESIIREEISKIDECGIKAVCLEARPHPDYAGEGWWHDVDIVLEEAKARNMRIWILDDAHFPTGMANGLLEKKYPERAKQYVNTKIVDVTGPLPYANLDVQQMMQREFTWMDIGKEIPKPLKDEKKLLSVTARKIVYGDVVSKEVLDLTEYVKDGMLTYSFPDGVWRVFVSFTTYDSDGARNYINIIDRESVQVLLEAVYEKHYERYGEEFGKTFAGFFSDEPGFGNTSGFAMDESIGRKMMPLPWNKEVPAMLEERLGSQWASYLPYLWYDCEDDVVSAEIRFVYMDIITQLYEKNFSRQIGEWCAAHGVEYIGHVIEDNNEHSRLGCGAGHYFRAMAGQHMAGMDNIGSQVLFGNADSMRHGFSCGDGPFYHYVLGKMAASAALFDPKKKGRLMCETYGAYGWGCGVKHMKWITDLLVSRGVNYLVPHAFSMAEYPDSDCPPHFYARGNNPQFPYFAQLMKYANRLCHIFQDGQSVPQAAIVYHGDLEWTNNCMYMQEPAKVLLQNQIEFCIVPIDALDENGTYETEVRDGALYINGVQIPMLIVPQTKYIDSRFVAFMQAHPEVKVLFINELPQGVVEKNPVKGIAVSKMPSGISLVTLQQLAETVKKDILGVEIEGTPYFITCYHYRKDKDLYMLLNESTSETFTGKVRIPGEGTLHLYDALNNAVKPVKQNQENGQIECDVELCPYESLILIADKEASLEQKDDVPAEDVSVMDISEDWTVSMAKAKEYPQFHDVQEMKILEPISQKYPCFSGVMKYEKTVMVSGEVSEAILRAEYIFEVAKICVNGQEAGMCLCPPYEFDLTGLIHTGENKIEIEVVNTLARDALNYESMFGPERTILEPSGMFGKIELICGK